MSILGSINSKEEKMNSKKKKICYVLTLGRTVKAFFLEQLSYLAENDFDVTVVCHDDCNLVDLLDVRIHLVNLPIPRGISLWGNIKALWALQKLFRNEHFNLVQYSTPNAALLAALAATTAKVPIRNYHIMGFRYEGAHGIGRWILQMLERISCKYSTNLECVCQATLEKGILAHIFPRDKVVVVGAGSTGGVDQKRFDYTRKAEWHKQIRTFFNYLDEDLVFGFVGRLTRDKGIYELLSAFRAVQAKITNAKLLLVGPVEDAKLCEQFSKYTSIVLTGEVDDVERYYSAMDVLVLPSYREGFGNVIIEAETMGVPCIASDIEGPRDAMQNEFTGLLVPAKNVQALANAMLKLANGELRERFADNAYAFAQRFDSRLLCRQILSRKNELIDLPGDR